METKGRQPETDPQRDATPCSPAGTLIVIGGHEQKEGSRPILELIAKRATRGKIVVITIVSEEPQEQWEQCRATFADLGVRHIELLDARSREELIGEERAALLDENTIVFFAGGDQMKIMGKFGGTPLRDRMRELYTRGALIAGTSSGASVMAEVMLSAGESESSPCGDESLRLAPGLGLISGVIIDQHLAERGRIGRLLGPSHGTRASSVSALMKTQHWCPAVIRKQPSWDRARCTSSTGGTSRILTLASKTRRLSLYSMQRFTS